MSTHGVGGSEFDILSQMSASEVGWRFRELVWYFENSVDSEMATTQDYANRFLACLNEATESQVKVLCEIISLLKNKHGYSLPALLMYHGLIDDMKSFEKMGLQLSPEDKMRFWPDYYSFSPQDLAVYQSRLLQYKQVLGLQPAEYNAPLENPQYLAQQAEIDRINKLRELQENREREELRELEVEIVKMRAQSFFLSRAIFLELYKKDEARYEEYKMKVEQGEKPSKEIREPVEQLSSKGLALLSYIYAQIDQSERQPIVCNSISSLKKITKLIDDAPVGTKITVIFQPWIKDSLSYKEEWDKYFSGVHKTVLHFEKTQEGMRVISMDGADNGMYSILPRLELLEAITENAKERHRLPSHLDFYEGNIFLPGKEKGDCRQKNSHECGIFATKDARELNRDPDFYEKYLSQHAKIESSGRGGRLVSYRYNLPTPYLKSYQSTTALKSLFEELDQFAEVRGNTIVTRKGKTLIEKFNEVGDAYTYHFSKKYHDRVTKFLNENSPEQIEAASSYYTADAMTSDRLVQVYGPASREVDHLAEAPSAPRPIAVVSAYHMHSHKQDARKEEKAPPEEVRSPLSPGRK